MVAHRQVVLSNIPTSETGTRPGDFLMASAPTHQISLNHTPRYTLGQ